MKKTTIIIALAVAMTIGMTGCAGGFASPTATADYGQPPSNYEATIKQHFETLLKDPDSAKYRMSKPRKAYGNKGLLYGGGVAWSGYIVRVAVNSKNGFGGYVGYRPYTVVFYNDSIRDVFPGDGSPITHEVD